MGHLNERVFFAQGSKEIRHDSLSFGKPVLGAGNMLIKDGVIVRLGLESGHYQPTVSNGVQVLNIFRNMGAMFSADAMMDFYLSSEKHSLTVEEFNEKFGQEIVCPL